MRQIKCNRCDTTEVLPQDGTALRGWAVVRTETTMEVALGPRAKPNVVVSDLCPDCSRAHTRWLNEPPPVLVNGEVKRASAR